MKGVHVSIRGAGVYCMYRKQVVDVYFLAPSSYFLLMLCAQRFTKVKVWGLFVCKGYKTKGGPLR